MANNIHFYSQSFFSQIITIDSASTVDNGDGSFTTSYITADVSSSASIYHPISTIELDSTNNFQIRLSSQSLNSDSDLIPFYISSSNPDPLIGLGTTNPLSNLDIRAASASSPASLILRTNEDGTIQVGEETGRIIFAIESSSYNFGGGLDFVSSGSTAAIFSRVLRSSSLLDTNHGSLIFEVNDSANNTEAIEILTLGHGLPNNDVTRGGIYTNTNRPIALLSASLIIDDDEGPFIHIRGGTNTGNPYRIADLGVITDTVSELVSALADNFDKGSLKLYHNSSSKVDLNSYNDYDYIHTDKNLGIGTATPQAKLHVEGSISASGDIIGNINGGSF